MDFIKGLFESQFAKYILIMIVLHIVLGRLGMGCCGSKKKKKNEDDVVGHDGSGTKKNNRGCH